MNRAVPTISVVIQVSSTLVTLRSRGLLAVTTGESREVGVSESPKSLGNNAVKGVAATPMPISCTVSLLVPKGVGLVIGGVSKGLTS